MQLVFLNFIRFIILAPDDIDDWRKKIYSQQSFMSSLPISLNSKSVEIEESKLLDTLLQILILCNYFWNLIKSDLLQRTFNINVFIKNQS